MRYWRLAGCHFSRCSVSIKFDMHCLRLDAMDAISMNHGHSLKKSKLLNVERSARKSIQLNGRRIIDVHERFTRIQRGWVVALKNSAGGSSETVVGKYKTKK